MTSDASGLKLIQRPDREESPTTLARRFREAPPWPHLVLDDVVSPERAAAAEAAELPFARTMPSHRSHRTTKAESPVPGSTEAQALLAELGTPDFLAFLETVTGISNLQSDPTSYWGGVQASGPASFQAVHSDFARHPVSGLFHRANVLLYLNSDWQPGFGGDLELWSRDLTRCEQRIAPVAGRMVVLETGRDMYHCVARPEHMPADRLRLVLTSHYYTVTAPPEHSRDPVVRRPRRPQDPWWIGFASPRDAAINIRAKLQHGGGRRT